ncbi:F-box protein At3g07870-like [Papaver somniferum]|uniref:F-box protein At3g07870-like n=1 Tax=Papaver somniferum TaxID=3469 RepID=UPI000E7007F8|nr:F-box protein At3g07870-like [Papaver somniferum]
MHGFGYSTSTKEYKVVSVCKSGRDPNFGILYVYTLGSGTGWRYVMKMDYDVLFHKQIGAFANGAVHWLGKEGTIVAFDLDDEEFRKLPPPPCLPRDGTRPSFGTLLVIGDVLCTYYKFKRGIEIWFLKENINNTGDVIWSQECSHVNVIPITFTNSGCLLCYDCCAKNVYHYVPTVSSFDLLGNFGGNFQFGIPHTNTLVSLKALGEEDTKQMDMKEQDLVRDRKQ